MSRILNIHIVIKYSTKAADKIGIKLPPTEKLLQSLDLQIPMPVLIENGEYQLWVDKYYIAYSRIDEQEIHYVYLTKEHISEEYDSYRRARHKQGNKVYLPKNIKNVFTAASNNMRATGKDFYLSKDFFEIE